MFDDSLVEECQVCFQLARPAVRLLFDSFYCKTIGRVCAAVTDENGLFDARGHALTLIVMIDGRVGLSLSRAERIF